MEILAGELIGLRPCASTFPNPHSLPSHLPPPAPPPRALHSPAAARACPARPSHRCRHPPAAWRPVPRCACARSPLRPSALVAPRPPCAAIPTAGGRRPLWPSARPSGSSNERAVAFPLDNSAQFARQAIAGTLPWVRCSNVNAANPMLREAAPRKTGVPAAPRGSQLLCGLSVDPRSTLSPPVPQLCFSTGINVLPRLF
ncbi:hypothetical protein BS78_08G064200 [Paspalum vaginatum]|nr:hypothetical protein BS78_08G064200 [Paspalum vaginatum]KAJ1265246.1 hypothetical protein BS78_08G064200 [Paspalum vaginatum]